MGFLYVEPRQIRQEALVRVRDLDSWTDLGAGNAEEIAGPARDGVLKEAAAFFATSNPVFADGHPLALSASRASFVEIGPWGISVVEGSKPIHRNTALIGIVLSYEIAKLPKEVVVRWELFAERQDTVPIKLYDSAGPLLSFATKTDRDVKWENFLKQYEEPKASP